MIKLIASDIDGTLVVDGTNKVNPEIFEVLIKLKEKGIQFAAASGRQWASIEAVFEPIKEKVFYLSDNGAYVGCHGRNLFLIGTHDAAQTACTKLKIAIEALYQIGLIVGVEHTLHFGTSLGVISVTEPHLCLGGNFLDQLVVFHTFKVFISLVNKYFTDTPMSEQPAPGLSHTPCAETARNRFTHEIMQM